MRVPNIEVVATDQYCQLQAWVESESAQGGARWFEPFLLWHRFPTWCEPYLRADRADPFLAALLLPAMMVGERLALPAPVSPLLLHRSWDIQAVYLAFEARARRIEIEAGTLAAPSSEAASGHGLFFSLGVDSFYSLLKNQRARSRGVPPITHLLAVHGIDVQPGKQTSDFPSKLLANSERVALETGTRLVPISTNVRRFSESVVGWPMSHGGALASIAQALSGLLGQVSIAATTTYDQLYPWGTHPALDPLWSTEELTVTHDGCEMGRIDKVAFIADSDLVLQTLRVCPGYSDAYNCGRCIKCLPTMIDLMQLGVLERSPVFPHAIDLDALRGMLRAHRGGLNVENYERRLLNLEASNGPPGLRDVLVEYLASEKAPGEPEIPPLLRQENRLTRLVRRLRDR
jgi:hypothetical protein